MSCNDQKNTQNEQSSMKKDIVDAALIAADAVMTSIAGSKLFNNLLCKAAKNGLDAAKAEKLGGVVSTGLSAGVLFGSDFIPTLAQIIDRKLAKDAPIEEELAPEIVEEVVEEVPVEEAVPVMAPVEAPVAVDEENEEEEDSFAGLNLSGVEFFDAKEQPEDYAALLEKESRGEIRIVTRYRRSFVSRLVQSQGDVQEYYSEIKNKLLSYKGVKGRTSWGNESFNKGRTYVAKVNAKSKTLYLYLALDPETVAGLEEGKYNFEDMSAKKKYENVPVLMKVKGPRKLKHALELIDLLCRDTLELPDAKNFEPADYTVPYQSTEELVESGAIKMMVAGIPMSDLPVTEEVTEEKDVYAVENA